MQPIRARLTQSYFLVLIIGMAMVGVLAWISVESLYLTTQRENLLAEAELTATAMQGQILPVQPAGIYNQTSNTLPGIHTRIIGEHGGVIFNLPINANADPVQSPAEDNTGFTSQAELLQRSEIQQALLGTPATEIRRVPAAGNRRVLYSAAPIISLDGKAVGIVYLASPLPFTGVPAKVVTQFGAALVIAFLLASTAGALIARGIARPIETVAGAAQAVAGGDLIKEVPVNSGISELNRLAQAFNTMTSNLRQSEKVKNAFIADVTHELRTPLTVIKGTIETLEDGAMDDVDGRDALLASMQSETERLVRLVNDLLVLTRADAGALRLDIKAINLGELVCSRCEYFSVLAAARLIKLEVTDKKQEKIIVLGDEDRIAQIIDNLLANAIRHTPDASTITIEISETNTEGQCAISDHGPGIPEKHLPFIFDRFYRADTSRDRQTGGAGLGLAIVRALLQAQGGRVQACSKEGEGSTFTFWLPRG
jgi:signal transduction histidine kinase